MNNIDLETFYSKIDDSIKLLAAYCEDPLLYRLVKSCRLKPLAAFEKGFIFDTKLYDKWVDEEGYIFQINKQGVQYCGRAHQETITDLFYGLSHTHWFSNSKVVSFFGDENISTMIFYCNDDYIRSFYYWDDIKGWAAGNNLLLSIIGSHKNDLKILIDKANTIGKYPSIYAKFESQYKTLFISLPLQEHQDNII